MPEPTDDAITRGQSSTRRRLLAGGAGVAALGLAAAPRASAATRSAQGLPVLHPADDWAEVLARSPQVQLEPGATYVLRQTVSLPDGAVIVGNGAIVTVADDTVTAFHANGVTDVSVEGVRLRGRDTDPINTDPEFAHVGIRITRSTNVRVTGCDFSFWRGAGVVLTGSTVDDYFDTGARSPKTLSTVAISAYR